MHLKRPGKKLRESLTKKRKTEFDVSKSRTVVSFSTLVRLPVPKKETVGTLLGLWNTGGLNNRVRTFIFKFYNNLLGLNTRLSHFVVNQNRVCTFCEGTVTTAPDENFIHIFLECPTTFDWHNQFKKKYLPHLVFTDLTLRTALFFYGKLPGVGTGTSNQFLTLSILIFQFCVWEEKLREKNLPFLQ
jgi:hypothetical protein